MLFCISPYLTGLAGFGLSAIGFGVFMLIQRHDLALPEADDPEQAGRELTLKLRQPVRYWLQRGYQLTTKQ